MEFSETEILFYSVAFVAGGLSCLARIWRDNESLGHRVVIGRCISSGFFGAGSVAVFVDWYPDSAGSSSFYFLAIAAFVGYMSRDFQDQVLTKAAKWIAKKLGPDDDEKPRPTQ